MADDTTKDELYEQAQAMDIEGRSTMSKEELEKAVEKEKQSRSKSGMTSVKVTPVIPPAPSKDEIRDTPEAQRDAETRDEVTEPADQTSRGGTVTGPDTTGTTAPATAPSTSPTTAPPSGGGTSGSTRGR